MNQESVVVTLKIYNRSFKLKVAANDEANVRSRAQDCNDKIEEFKKAFPGRDIQDYLSMFIIQMMDKKGEMNQKKSESEFLETLQEMNALFDND